MRDYLKSPPWRAEDLGAPIPDSPHAVSVSLPTWAHNIGYEEGDPKVVDVMKTGYPRFFMPRVVRRLCGEIEKELGRGEEKCLVFWSPEAAERCRAFVEERHDGWKVRTTETRGGIGAFFFPEEVRKTAELYWRYCGEIVSTREAESNLAGKSPDEDAGSDAQRIIRERIAETSICGPEDVYLFPSGMMGVYAVHRMLQRVLPGKRTEQFDFPYVDVLKVQEEFGAGASFHHHGNAEGLAEVVKLMKSEGLAGVFCEMPSNPLLRSVDLPALKDACRQHATALVVDDTVGTSVNVDVDPFGDVMTTSLTKFFSGLGDVMAGAVRLNPESPFYSEFKSFLEMESDAGMWWEDAVVLEENSRDFEARVRKKNENGEALCDYLREHPLVESLYFPKWATRESYDTVRREGGGFGALFSMVLKDRERTSPQFFDALRVSKGPSLGTNYSICCPYTLLAYYEELETVEACGVSRWLIRFSAGMEEIDDLIGRFEDAFAACS